jgi:ribosome-associated translation inhibitor RaiA
MSDQKVIPIKKQQTDLKKAIDNAIEKLNKT